MTRNELNQYIQRILKEVTDALTFERGLLLVLRGVAYALLYIGDALWDWREHEDSH